MAAEDFISAKDRLEQAKNEVIWLISVSSDPASHTKDYDLAPEEQEALHQESKKHLVEIIEAMEGIPSWDDPQLRSLPGIPSWPDPDLKPGTEAYRGQTGRDKPIQENEDR